MEEDAVKIFCMNERVDGSDSLPRQSTRYVFFFIIIMVIYVTISERRSNLKI